MSQATIRRAMTYLTLVIVLSTGRQSVWGQSDSIVYEVSYSEDVSTIIKEFCTTCHAGENPEGDLRLTSYESVREHVKEGNLLDRINNEDDPMPPSGLMPSYMRRVIKSWAGQGFIEQGTEKKTPANHSHRSFVVPKIVPVDVTRQGFELLRHLKGHWVGSMELMGQEFEWWAFDFRPISPSHIHGLFEGGTIGNLFTSFFVADFSGKKTIVARNGGLLNGIYRTSYFVLEEVKYGRDWAYYRLVDAYGGSGIMYMELTFRGDAIQFDAYTSRFGLTAPKPHMAFRARRMHAELAEEAAKAVGFPNNVVDFDLSGGFPKPTWTDKYPQTSATYIWEGADEGLVQLGKLANDPRRIDQMPFLSQLEITFERVPGTEDKKVLLYLSRDALVDSRGKFIKRYGYIREELLNTLLLFPELAANQNEFNFTYLHPGDYFITAVVDMDGDGFPSPGDLSNGQTKVTVKPSSKQRLHLGTIGVQN